MDLIYTTRLSGMDRECVAYDNRRLSIVPSKSPFMTSPCFSFRYLRQTFTTTLFLIYLIVYFLFLLVIGKGDGQQNDDNPEQDSEKHDNLVSNDSIEEKSPKR